MKLDTWLRQHATTLDRLAADPETDDLRPLRQSFGGARVIGLGETTHGTKEFFQIRHRLLRFVVEELGFNVFAIEGSYSAAQLVNDYVRGGRGDRESVLTSLGSVMWDVVEFGDVLDWLRDYNHSVPEARRVHFLGIDIFHTRLGREWVLASMRRLAPQHVASTEALFQAVAAAEARGLLVAHEVLSKEIAYGLRGLINSLTSERSVRSELESDDEYEGVLRQLEVILQWMGAYGIGATPLMLPRVSGLNNHARSLFMADNLIRFMESAKREVKVALWAHNFHVSVGFDDGRHGILPNLGRRLRERLGDEYYSLALELNQGDYLCRQWAEHGRTLGDLKLGRILPAPESWLPWHLARAGQQFILDLRANAAPPEVALWLESPQTTYCAGWAHSDPTLTTQVVPKEQYDGILFIESTTATTPTANALSTVARRATH